MFGPATRQITCRNSLEATGSDLDGDRAEVRACHDDVTGLAAGVDSGPCDHEQVVRSRLLILVTGCVPGAGKSSLAASLATALEGGGTRVELFREEHIRSHPAFSLVMSEFDAAGEVRLETLIASAADYLRSARERRTDVFVLDALFPYLPSLLAWGYADDEIADFFTRLAALFDGFVVVELHVVADARNALTRATEREGGDWLKNHTSKVSRFRTAGQVLSSDDVVAYYGDATARSQAVLTRAPWPVERICADDGPASANATAMAVVVARSMLGDQS